MEFSRVTTSTDIADFLRRELAARIGKNPRYSLRAFARDLEVTAPTLCRVIRGDRGISRDKAIAVAGRLNLSPEESATFAEIADAMHARVRSVRDAAQARLARKADQFQRVDVDAFQIVAEWYHFGILCLLDLPNARSSPDWLAKRLGISKLQAEEAVTRLLRNGMLRRIRGKKLEPTGQYFVESPKLPSAVMREFHVDMMRRASTALQTQPMDEREFSTQIMPVAEADLPEAKRWIRKFRADFDQRFSQRAKRKDRVMALGIQYYRADVPPRKKAK